MQEAQYNHHQWPHRPYNHPDFEKPEDPWTTTGRVFAEQNEFYLQFYDMLWENGYAAQHPDDGWVDRKKNTAALCYPGLLIPAKIQTGALVALGYPEKWRTVQIVEVQKNTGILAVSNLVRFSFTDVETPQSARDWQPTLPVKSTPIDPSGAEQVAG